MKTTYMAALGLVWQLAIVVIIPIVAGLKADDHFGSSPLWTLIGFGLAMILLVLVVWRQAKQFSPNNEEEERK